MDDRTLLDGCQAVARVFLGVMHTQKYIYYLSLKKYKNGAQTAQNIYCVFTD